MRLVVMSALGGCSVLYNPSNIPMPDPDGQIGVMVDAMVDAEVVVDADPSMLMVTKVAPAVIVEGQGDGGSRAALILIEGSHFDQNLTLAITASAGATKTPLLTIDNANIQIDANGRRIAVPIMLPVDTGLGAGETISLDIKITQDTSAGPVMRELLGMLTVKGLAELTATPTGFPAGVSEYSTINLTTGTIRALAGVTQPINIRAVSSITIASAVNTTVSASARTGGPGGGNGGLGGPGGLLASNAGTAGTGPAPGLPPGGPGRFEGNDQLSTFGDKNFGSGGAGGSGGGFLGGTAGGDGGGGGGSIELTAGGDLSIGNIAATGAAGAAGANVGGGGSGGVVLLRAGRNLAAGTVNVMSLGSGQAGRARFDAGGTGTVQSASVVYRGPMFVGAPLITLDETPMLTVSGGPLKGFRYYTLSDAGQVAGPFDDTFDASGTKSFSVAAPLAPGLNQLCLLVPGADATSDTRNCISIAHLYKP